MRTHFSREQSNRAPRGCPNRRALVRQRDCSSRAPPRDDAHESAPTVSTKAAKPPCPIEKNAFTPSD